MDTQKKLRKLRNRRRAEKRGKVKAACVLLGLWLAFSVFLVYAAERQAEAYRAEPSVVMNTLQDARRVWTGKHMELKVWIGGVECETDDGWLGWTYGLSDTLEGLEQRLEAQIGSLARAEYARLGRNSPRPYAPQRRRRGIHRPGPLPRRPHQRAGDFPQSLRRLRGAFHRGACLLPALSALPAPRAGGIPRFVGSLKRI